VRKEKKPERNPSLGAVPGSKHPLVGTWEQEPNPNGTTSVLYSVVVKARKFLVTAKDRGDGTVLRISCVRWDGEALHFRTVFPPTNHESRHVLRSLSKGRISHDVACTYADGENFSDREFWKRVRVRKEVARSKK